MFCCSSPDMLIDGELTTDNETFAGALPYAKRTVNRCINPRHSSSLGATGLAWTLFHQ